MDTISITISILIIWVLVILWLYLINYNNNERMTIIIEPKNNKQYDKPYMWIYWELINGATKPPDYIQMCLELIKKNGSRFFNVVVLNEKNVFDYIPDLRKDINTLPIALKTDYIRVKLLYLYGGLWADMDTILMNNLKDIAGKLNLGVDYIGCGCTGAICIDQEGYGKPSNGFMGSIKNGKLIGRCLKALDTKLNEYYSISPENRKSFDYFELGKLVIWREYDQLMMEDPSYKYYHIPSYSDGTRDISGNWVAPDLIFDKKIVYQYPDKLLFVMLANSYYCGRDVYYNWFCKLSKEQILNGKYFITELFKRAYEYDPYSD